MTLPVPKGTSPTMTTAGRRRKSTFLTGQDAVAPSVVETVAPPEAAPAPEETQTGKKKPATTDTRRRLQVQMDIEDLAELRSAYNQVAQRGETLSDFVAGIITERIRQYRDEANGGRPFAGAGTVTRGRPPKY